VGGTHFLFILFPCVSCYEHLSLSSDVPRGKGIRLNEVQIKVKTGNVQYCCIARGTGWMKKCSSGCHSYIMSLRTASSGLHGLAARNQGISQLHAHIQLWFTQRMCSLYSSAFRVGFWNRSSLKQRRRTSRNLAILRNCVLLTDREEKKMQMVRS
jgi:hypothetical protein